MEPVAPVDPLAAEAAPRRLALVTFGAALVALTGALVLLHPPWFEQLLRAFERRVPPAPLSVLRAQIVAVWLLAFASLASWAALTEARRGRLATAILGTARAAAIGMAVVAAYLVALALGNRADGYDEISYLTNALAFFDARLYYHPERPPLVPVLALALGERVSLVNALSLLATIGLVYHFSLTLVGCRRTSFVVAALVAASDGSAFFVLEARPDGLCVGICLGSIAASVSRRPVLAGVLAALAILGRWNYASVALFLAAALLVMQGWRALVAFTLAGVATGLPYAIFSSVRLGSPLAGPLALWGVATDDSRWPTALERLGGYVGHAYFIGPVLAVAIVGWLAWIIATWRARTPLERMLAGATLDYIVPLHFVSTPLARYTLFLVPVAAVAMAQGLVVLARFPVARRIVWWAACAGVAVPAFAPAHRIAAGASCHTELERLAEPAAAAAHGAPIYARLPNAVVTYFVRQPVVGVGEVGDAGAARPGACAYLWEHARHFAIGTPEEGWPTPIEPQAVPDGALIIDWVAHGTVIAETPSHIVLSRKGTE